MSWAGSVEGLRRQQPDPLHRPARRGGRSGMSGRPKQNSSTTDAVFLPMPLIAGQPVARLERGHVAEELERVVAAFLADLAERRLDPRRLLVGEPARPDDVDQLLDRRELDARPVRRRAVRQAAAAPALARARGAPARGPTGRPRGARSNATSAFMSAVFWVRIVRISSLVGSRRRSQIGVAVDAGELVEREVDEARAGSDRGAASRRRSGSGLPRFRGLAASRPASAAGRRASARVIARP